ncbi:MAG: hypothetical protein AAFN07_17105 [Pseudomonadota bacterium]
MTPLELLLIVKISVTLITVAMPFLLLPANRIEQIAGFGAAEPLLYRLYGVAILALLVGYFGGLQSALGGELPQGVLRMGFVSNAGAALLLLRARPAAWKWPAIAFFAAISAGLALAMTNPSWALQPLG